MTRNLLRGLALVAMITLVPALPARASCAAPPPLEQAYAEAEVVFRGTVTATDGSERIATVQVEDVWKGSSVPETVEVRGGPRGENVATSVDRHFEVGVTYLFFPTNTNAPFKDNICTLTRPYDPSLEGLRESGTGEGGASPPLPLTGPDPIAVWLVGASALMSGGVIMLITADRRRRETGSRTRTPARTRVQTR